MSTVKDRLMLFLKEQGISKSEFARKMGLSQAYVSSMRKSMPEERITRLLELYPSLNRDWLLYGEGEMIVQESNNPDIVIDDYIVPLLPVEACAGHLSLYSEGVALADCEKIVSPVKGVDFAIRVDGDSMEPEIHNGTYLFINRINDKAFIPWGHPMVLDSENGTLVKVLYPSDKGNKFIRAESYNLKYPPYEIPTDSIYGIYRIKAQVLGTRIL